MVKVSVIVPVYNVEKYLRTCMDSILSQSLEDIEIICVDDGSTDNSPEILDEYAQKDRRVKVIHKKNSGYGNSMNVGIDMAQGEYIGIVESDDYILPDMYKTLYACASAYDLDLVKSECIQFWDTLSYSRKVHVKEMEPYFGKLLKKEDRIRFYQFYMNTWSGIYRRQFLVENGIRHNETPGASYQDNGFWIQTMSLCERAMWLDDAFYLYRQDNPMASVKSKDKIWVMHKEYLYIEKLLEEKGLKKELAICKYYHMLRHKGVFIRIREEYKQEYARQMFCDWDKYYGDIKDLDIRSKEHLFGWIDNLKEKGKVEKVITDNQTVKAKIDSFREIIIYGAGAWAEYVCLKLYNIGCYDKVKKIWVSGTPEHSSLCGRPIETFSEDINTDDTLVIISVKGGGNAYCEIEEKLRKYGIKNYMGADTIFYNFYMT